MNAPPLRPRTPLLFAGGATSVLTAVVLLLVRPPGPLDAPSLADQRNGIVARGPVLDRPIDGVSFGRAVVILLFVRARPSPATVRAWARGLPAYAVVHVVVQQPGQTGAGDVVLDPSRLLASAVRLPQPRDGGPGIGYAVVDATSQVRYATLDPDWQHNASEVATVARSV